MRNNKKFTFTEGHKLHAQEFRYIKDPSFGESLLAPDGPGPVSGRRRERSPALGISGGRDLAKAAGRKKERA